MEVVAVTQITEIPARVTRLAATPGKLETSEQTARVGMLDLILEAAEVPVHFFFFFFFIFGYLILIVFINFNVNSFYIFILI